MPYPYPYACPTDAEQPHTATVGAGTYFRASWEETSLAEVEEPALVAETLWVLRSRAWASYVGMACALGRQMGGTSGAEVGWG